MITNIKFRCVRVEDEAYNKTTFTCDDTYDQVTLKILKTGHKTNKKRDRNTNEQQIRLYLKPFNGISRPTHILYTWKTYDPSVYNPNKICNFVYRLKSLETFHDRTTYRKK